MKYHRPALATDNPLRLEHAIAREYQERGLTWEGKQRRERSPFKTSSCPREHRMVPESLIVVVDNPPFLVPTHVKNVPHLGHLSPMASSIELITGSKNSEHNCSCTLLFLRVGEDLKRGEMPSPERQPTTRAQLL